jgi:NDP-sugar pyrophosphorylase family protein
MIGRRTARRSAASRPARGLHAVILPPIKRPGMPAPGGASWSPLMRIGGRTLFEHQLALLHTGDVTDAHIVDPDHASELRARFGRKRLDAGVQLHFPLRGRKALGRNAALQAALADVAMQDDIVVCLDANVLTTQQLRPLIRWHLRRDALATLLLVPLAPSDAFEVDRVGRVRGYTDRPVAGRWVNGGLYVVTPEFLRRLGDDGDPEETTLPALARAQRLYGLRSRAGWFAFATSEDATVAEQKLRLRSNGRV